MRVNVHVHGLHFAVPCGEGTQSLKWLGLVVAQRYALAVPHGRCRTREDAHLKPGFFLPANVFKTHGGQVLAPFSRIVDVCKDNDNITVHLQQEVPVNEIGAPQLSPWATSAFGSQSKTNELSSTNLSPHFGAKTSPSGEAKTGPGPSRAEEKEPSSARPAEAKTHADEIKEYARSEMLQQVNSGQFQSEMELEAAFLYDWSRLRMDELEKDAKERDAVQELLLANFGHINAAYMHYAVGSGEAGFGMNGFELAHFLHECGLYHFQQDAAAIEKIYSQCARNNAFLSLHDRESLARVGFFHALLRAMIFSPREASSGGSTLESLEKKLNERIIPAVTRLTSGPFRDHTHHDKIVALFQETKPKLMRLYAKYAQEHGGKTSKRDDAGLAWPQLLNAAGLKSMLYDCGVFCVGDTQAHDEIFNQAMEQCFGGFKGVRDFDEQEVVFAEFIEVLTRVGITVLDENDIPAKDAIKITLDALRSLPVKSLRK